MKRNEQIVKINDQLYCRIFDLYCKKYTIDSILYYVELTDIELIKSIKKKL